MKIYSLEFVSSDDGVAERIWHTNRRALERYSRTLTERRFQVRGIRGFDITSPVTDSRLVAFLNAHCADCVAPAPTSARQRPAGAANSDR